MRHLARAALAGGLAAGLLALGAGTAVAAVAVHEIRWGLPLAVAATVLALLALPPGWWTRLPFAAGWAALVGWVASPRPEGDYAVSSDGPGWTLVVLALLALVWGIATLPRPRRRTRPTPARAPETGPEPSLHSTP